VPLPPAAIVSGRVLDSGGSPVPAARVYVRSVASGWTLARSVAADAAGAFSVTLRAGSYQVQAAPDTDPGAPALSPVQAVEAPSTGVDLVCPPKVRRYGVVIAPDGKPVGSNFQVLATRLADALITTRTAAGAATDSTATYHLVADPGRWRLEVVPPPDAALPRKIVQFDLDGSDPGESALPAIQLSTALKAGGTVKGSAPGAPDVAVAGAQVSFFALDAQGHGVLLGSGMTDAQGRYNVILPDVGQSSLAP